MNRYLAPLVNRVCEIIEPFDNHIVKPMLRKMLIQNTANTSIDIGQPTEFREVSFSQFTKQDIVNILSDVGNNSLITTGLFEWYRSQGIKLEIDYKQEKTLRVFVTVSIIDEEFGRQIKSIMK
jgi:hypothetical protein